MGSFGSGMKIGWETTLDTKLDRDTFLILWGILCNASCVGTLRTVLMVQIKSDVLRNSQSHDYGVG